jgi:hypothetical protein
VCSLGSAVAHAEPLPVLNNDGTLRDPDAKRGPIDGFAVAIGLNTSTSFGLGADGFRGGGGLSIRFGTEATPTMLWLLQLDSVGYLVENVDPMSGDTTTDINAQSVLTLGAQKYVTNVAWVRGGGGFATFTRRQRTADEPKEQVGGLGLVASAGLDVLRSGIFALSLELLVTAGRYDGGSIGTGGLSFTGTWY